MAVLSRWCVRNVDVIEVLLCDSCKCGVLITMSLLLRECLAIRADIGSDYMPYSEGICVHCR